MCSMFRNTHVKPGGFSEYFLASALHVQRDTLLLPEQVSFKAGTLIEPLACIIHAIRKAGVNPEDSVVLIGTGTMGLMFIEALQYLGITSLVVYEVIPWRLEKAREFGARTVLSPLTDPTDELKRLSSILSSDGADKVFVAAKDIRAMELGVHLSNKGGTVLLFATPSPEKHFALYPSRMFFREQTIVSSYSANHLDTRLALEMLASGAVDAERLITHEYPLERLSDAILQTAGRGESLKCVVTM